MLNAELHLDGWIMRSARGDSFYGLIDPHALRKLVQSSGLSRVSEWTHDGSAYVVATKR